MVLIKAINETSPYLPEVNKLGDSNKATLGFFSKGAFEEKARKKQILVALSDSGEFMGYLMYRNVKSHNRISIIHLCIKNNYRGQGIAKQLLNYLKSITSQYRGIELRCRRDYGIDNMWLKLGFCAVYDKKAKTKGKLLTYWWLDYGHPNLLSLINDQKSESKLSIIIDYSIFQEIYLHNHSSKPQEEKSKDSKVLLADWLEPNIEMWVSKEILNKINQINDYQKRKSIRNIFSQLSCINYTDKQYQKFLISIKSLIQENNLLIDESYLRHIVQSLASGINIILTNNVDILKLSDQFYEEFKVILISPNDFIKRFDDIEQQKNYQSRLFAGIHSLKQLPISLEEVNKLKHDLVNNCSEEEQQYFLENLRNFIFQKDTHECLIIKDEDNEPIALIVYNRIKKEHLEITMIRISKHYLAETVARHLLFTSISISAQEGRQLTKITDKYLQDEIINMIQEDYFIETNNELSKLNLSLIDTKTNIAEQLNKLEEKLPELTYFFQKFSENLTINNLNAENILLIERYLFPLKIIDHDINNFIIPIKPKWAADLFDQRLAEQTLFGFSQIKLALNREAVYYKSKSSPKQLIPGISGRILWYVSSGSNSRKFCNVGRIRACSRLDEVIIGTPKELHRKYRHLGIYELSNILEVAKNDEQKEIIAIKFSDTELFEYPVSLKDAQKILESKTTFTSSTYINNEKFAIIYKQGMKGK
ncbi:GNAT family N-acetyltransferase [Crocosphaera sp.]|uniref:GNAT family N-acetyltransferase n=1 Tax=Crocosphaera sp. TaxID=2729996 RepID=UPI0026309EBE|nr:GNAT family N-acetyltransferase [Crocosphaera sp.]MDJ0583265.1 GNAT family N-acetyltransferase [Crocosphaera sp.]